MLMFDHISLGVSDLERSLNFYDAIMKTLGQSRKFGAIEEGFMAYGPERGFLVINTPLDPEYGSNKATNGSHFCFTATTPAMVDAFYEVAMANGATSNGAPGLRPHYAEDYYAAYVHDPDGHKLEAVARIPKAT